MKWIGCITLVLLSLAQPAAVFGLGEESFGNRPVVKQPSWAEGIVNVANLKSRVYLRWVNGNESFFFRGNAQELSEALRKYAAVQDDVRQVTLLPGPGATQSFDGKAVVFDWQLDVPSGIYRAVSKRTHAVMTVYINAKKPRADVDRKPMERWVRELNDDRFPIRENAQRELEMLGNDAKPILRASLKTDPGPEARRRINVLLNRIHSIDVTDLEVPPGVIVLTAQDLVANGLKQLKDTNPTVRGMALQDLSRLAFYNDRIVPTTIARLAKDENEWVRRVAASNLAHIGVGAKSALPALKAGLSDPDANIRHAFQSAIDLLEKAKEKPGESSGIQAQRAILNDIKAYKKSLQNK